MMKDVKFSLKEKTLNVLSVAIIAYTFTFVIVIINMKFSDIFYIFSAPDTSKQPLSRLTKRKDVHNKTEV